MEELRRDLETFQAGESSRSATLKRILVRLNAAIEENAKLNTRLNQAEYLNQKYHEDLEQHKNQLLDIKRITDRDPFVLVLIDGDISLFNDGFIQRGAFGGHDAARELRKRIIDYLESSRNLDYSPQCKLIIKVYSKAMGLSRTYVGKGIISQVHTFQQFVNGFNQEHALCEFIDAGDDKEGADTKLKANLEAFFHNVHCKHILLGVSGDNSYAGFLRQYRPTDNTSHRITLIRALPFPRDFYQLAEEFLTTDMNGIFRPDKLIFDSRYPDREERALPPSSPRADSYTAIVDHPTLDQEDNSPSLPPILRNSKGYRLDPPVNPDKSLVGEIKARKLCNRHFLSKCDNESCKNKHEATLSDRELETLRYIARFSPCFKNVHCSDRYCVMGHYCIWAPQCHYGKACKYKPNMHHGDLEVTSVS